MSTTRFVPAIIEDELKPDLILDQNESKDTNTVVQLDDNESIYTEFPYVNQIAYDVDMDNFAVLKAGKAHIYDIDDFDGIDDLDEFEDAGTANGIDFLCSLGSSSCIIIYATVKDCEEISAIAHASSLTSLNNIMTCMQMALAKHMEKQIEEIYINFFHFGGTAGSISDFKEDEAYPAPKYCRIDATSRLINKDEEDSISVFATKDHLTVEKNISKKRLFYKQSYDFDSKPELLMRPTKAKQTSIFVQPSVDIAKSDDDGKALDVSTVEIKSP